MAHSSIKIKNCKYPGCPYYPVWGADGYCWRHESAESKSLKNANRYAAKKEKIPLDSSYLVRANNAASVAQWFAHHMQNSERRCDNCGADLSDYDYVGWHGSQHHVLEKSQFPSVKTNLLNHLVLGMYCCHSQIHTSHENASRMNVFSKAQDIVIKLYPLLTYNEIKKISVYYTFEKV